MEGVGTVIGKKAPDFTLPDHLGGQVKLSEVAATGPVLLVFYPGDFTRVCTKQLCNYRDHWDDFKNLGIQIVGVSPNAAFDHSRFAKKFDFPFRLLTDQNQKVARAFDCTSFFMFGRLSRACFIINPKMIVLYRYVEATTLTHRSADELLGIITDLKANKIL